MTVLVVGIGNDLRRDDGAGRVVADRIDDLDLPGVIVRSVHQLTPELALDVAASELTVFVDADVSADETAATPIVAICDDRNTATTHIAAPASLLAMTRHVGGDAPPAHLVSIPVVDLGVGEGLSEATAACVETAIVLVRELIAGAHPNRGVGP